MWLFSGPNICLILQKVEVPFRFVVVVVPMKLSPMKILKHLGFPLLWLFNPSINTLHPTCPNVLLLIKFRLFVCNWPNLFYKLALIFGAERWKTSGVAAASASILPDQSTRFARLSISKAGENTLRRHKPKASQLQPHLPSWTRSPSQYAKWPSQRFKSP